jgi:CheY-like chemotaxis protein
MDAAHFPARNAQEERTRAGRSAPGEHCIRWIVGCDGTLHRPLGLSIIPMEGIVTGSLVGRTILVVEDEMLIALDVADTLVSEGAEVIASKDVKDALAKCETPGLSAVVLDHKLAHEDTSAVCEKLERMSIPFIIYSGYSKLEGACSKGELVPKPANPHAIVVALLDAMTKDQSPSIH